MYSYNYISGCKIPEMLVNFTIFPDIKLYQTKSKYFELPDEEFKKLSKKEIEKNLLENAKAKTLVSLSLEAERILKKININVPELKEELKEKGYYESPLIIFRYMGYIAFKPRKIVLSNEQISSLLSQEISLHNLFLDYSSPLPYAYYNYYDIPIGGYEKVSGRIDSQFSRNIGEINFNHRDIQKKVIGKKDKVIRMFKSKFTSDESIYKKTWEDFYTNYEIR